MKFLSLFYSELKHLVTPQSAKELVDFNTEQSIGVSGRFAEALLLNDAVNIPIGGPALEIVALIRLLGQNGLEAIFDVGALTFSFHPGTFAYISQCK